MKEYKTIAEESLDKLDKAVSVALKQGGELHGNAYVIADPAASNILICQPVLLEIKPPPGK